MSKHQALNTFGRSGNPIIRSAAFQDKVSANEERMSLEGAVNDTKEKNVRLLAEFDNYKRRITESIIEKNKYDGIALIKEIIPIIDDVDRILNIRHIIGQKSWPLHRKSFKVFKDYMNMLKEAI